MTYSHVRNLFSWIFFLALTVIPTMVFGQAVVYGLADDWSNTNNPNAVWSYTGDDGVILATNFADWDPTSGCCFTSPQPAWAAATWPNLGHVPMWFKSISAGELDMPMGRVGMHGSQASTSKWVGVVWTSPFSGGVDINGGVWNAAKTFLPGRSSDWRLRKNGTVLTEGIVTTNDAFNSSTPFDLRAGSGGTAALSGVRIAQGDEVVLEFISPSSAATFVGVDLTVTEAEVSLAVVTEKLPTFISGDLVSFDFTADSGQPPYVWSIVDGTLPTGLTLSAAGQLGGTPTDSGKFYVKVQVTDDLGDMAEKGFELTVLAEGVFDLATDWSDTFNPNGPWSYNGTPGTPLTNHWDDWDPTSGCCFTSPQPAWAAATWPNTGHVPVWLKVASDTTVARDFPIGKVIMHGDEGSGPPAKAGATWTSPINGVVTIDGGVWLVDVTSSRSMDWNIYLNGSPLTGGSLTPDDPRSSIAPFKFRDGSGGASVLTQTVAVGDVVTLEFEKTSTFASFVGVDMTIFSSIDIDSIIPSAILLGEPLSQQLTAVAGLPPLEWSVFNGQLPPGLVLSQDGILSGTPTNQGLSTFSVQVMDSNGKIAEKAFTVETVLMLPPPNISIKKSGTIVVPGRYTTYFIVVENTGQFIARDLVIREVLDPLEYFSDPSLFVPAPTTVIGNLVEWVIDQLEPGEKRVITYGVTITPTVSIGDLVKGNALQVCDKCKDSDACKNLDLACDFFSPSIPTGIPSLSDLFGAWFNANWPSTACTGFTTQCAEDCKRSCPSGSDDKDATGPVDPNEKVSIGNRFIQADETLTYAIHFENIGEVEAIDVFVTDVLDVNLDETTLNILTPEGASYAPVTRTLKWELIGRNLQPGETGHVMVSIRPKPGLPSGTVIRNSAEIQFEIFDPLITPEVVNVIDTDEPNCTMDALPSQVPSAQFDISWTGVDVVGEIETYSIYASENGGTYELMLSSADTATTFTGVADATYDFFCVAKDTAGNIESQMLTAETSTVVGPDADGDGVGDLLDNCTMRANADQLDTNGDGYGNICDGDLDNSGGVVNFGDLALFKTAFGTTDPDADFDGSGGVVNFGDLATFKILFGQPPGPSCCAP